jgi:murein DD-endopeptidase MepM/ murein hydrolase activator NlpD
MNKISFLFITIFFFGCVSVHPTSERASLYAPSPSGEISYIIKERDSLYKISKKYGISIREIVRRNKIPYSQPLKPGQEIILPITRKISSVSFSWPVEGKIISFFGENIDNFVNKGVNILVSPENKKVKASADGKVVFCNDLKGWGKTIVLKHTSDLYTVYANLDTVSAKEGVHAKSGQIIGETASSKGGNYIFHFEIRKRHIPQDPLVYLN